MRLSISWCGWVCAARTNLKLMAYPEGLGRPSPRQHVACLVGEALN